MGFKVENYGKGGILIVAEQPLRSVRPPAYPKAVADIVPSQLFPGVYALGSRALDCFIVIPEAKLSVAIELVARLDGTKALEMIGEEYQRQHGRFVDVRGLHDRLREAGLLDGSKARGEIQRLAITLVDLPISGLLPWWVLMAQAFTPLVWMSGIVILAGLWVALTHLSTFIMLATEPIQMTPGILYPIAALSYLVTILWHEASHAIVGARCGLVPSRLKAVAYLVFIPLFVIKIPGIYVLEPKLRIHVWAAGIWGSLTLGAVFVLAALATPPGGAWQHLAARIAAANVVVAAANCVPFLLTDGYFILSTVSRQTNIRGRAWREVTGLAGRGRSSNWLLLWYAVVSGAFMAFLVVRGMKRMYGLGQHSAPILGGLVALIAWPFVRKIAKSRWGREKKMERV